MATLPSMGLETGVISGDRGTWGGKINSNMTKIDAHTHVSGQGEQVPVAGILIDDDLSFNNTFGCTDLHAITFASIVALSDNEYNKSLFVSNGTGGLINGELYWRNTSGNHVQLTSGNSLNVSAFVGGIGGDYSAVGALLDYDDSTKTYRLRQQVGSSVRQFARMSAGGVNLFEFKAHPAASPPTQFVRLSSPASLASSYTVTFPAALPASTQLVQVDNAGQVSFSNTVAQAITASAGVTVGANQNVTVSGTGRYKHGTETISVHGSAFQPITSSTAVDYSSNGCMFTGGTGVIANVTIPQGRRITAARFYIRDNATGPSVIQCDLSRMTTTGTLVGNISAGSSGAGADQTITVTPTGSNGNANALTAHQIKVFYNSGSAQCRVYLVEIDWDIL